MVEQLRGTEEEGEDRTIHREVMKITRFFGHLSMSRRLEMVK